MTLDEMIAWLGEQAAQSLSFAARHDRYAERLPFTREMSVDAAQSARDDAATLLAIENALRAVRDGVAV